MIRLGAQCSIAPGFRKAIEEAHQAGLNTVQVFSRSPVGGQTKGLPPPSESLSILKEEAISLLVVHAPYFVNPAATDTARRERASQVLRQELVRTRDLAGELLVLHPGHRSSDERAPALSNLCRTLIELQATSPRVLVENTAGQGKEIGDHLDELRMIFNQVPQVGLMLDTAHAMAAGYPLGTGEDWKRLADEIDRVIGLKRLAGIHLNDSAYPVGARRDRHAHLFGGPLGYGAAKALLSDADRYLWPVILETPGKNGEARSDDIIWVRKLTET